jgi:plasmid stabilization system protein ParE
VTPRHLVVAPLARLDIERQAERLREARGNAFAERWTIELRDWLRRQAAHGAVLGTEHPTRPGFRTFGYRGQATILATYGADTFVVVRFYARGLDWSR